MITRIITKLTSGQFILTVLSGVTVSWCVINTIDIPEWAQTTFAMVFTLYFKRERDNEQVTT